MWATLRSLTSTSWGSASSMQLSSPHTPSCTVPDLATTVQRPSLQSTEEISHLHLVPPSVYASLSAIVYNEKGHVGMPAGWRVLMSCASCGLHREGYYAVAYVHEASRHCIIAARGTSDVFGLRAAVWLYFEEMTIQLCLAEQFSKLVRERLASLPSLPIDPSSPEDGVSREGRPDWAISARGGSQEREDWFVSYTGHSLGAVIATWRAVEEHTYAVTFESPGCLQLLEKVQNRCLGRNEAVTSTVNYVRLPNPINTLKSHCGYLVMLPISAQVMPSGTFMLADNKSNSPGSSNKSIHGSNCISNTISDYANPDTRGAVVVNPVAVATAAVPQESSERSLDQSEVAASAPIPETTAQASLLSDKNEVAAAAAAAHSVTTLPASQPDALTETATKKSSSRLSSFFRLKHVSRGGAEAATTKPASIYASPSFSSPSAALVSSSSVSDSVPPPAPASRAATTPSTPRWRTLSSSMPVFRVPSIRSYAAAYTRDRMLTSVGIPELQQYLTKVEPVVREMMEHTQQVHSIHNFVHYFAHEEARSRGRSLIGGHPVVAVEKSRQRRRRMNECETVDALGRAAVSDTDTTPVAATDEAVPDAREREPQEEPPMDVHESEEVVLQWPSSVLQFVEYYNTARALDDPMNKESHVHAAYESLLRRLCDTEPRPVYRMPARFLPRNARTWLELWWRWPAERRQELRLAVLDHKALNCMRLVRGELWTETLTALEAKQYVTRLVQRRSIRDELRRVSEAKERQEKRSTSLPLARSKL